MDDKKNSMKVNLGSGFTLGVAFGLCLGVVTNDIGIWLPIGIALGLALGYGKYKVFGNVDSDSESKDSEEAKDNE